MKGWHLLSNIQYRNSLSFKTTKSIESDFSIGTFVYIWLSCVRNERVLCTLKTLCIQSLCFVYVSPNRFMFKPLCDEAPYLCNVLNVYGNLTNAVRMRQRCGTRFNIWFMSTLIHRCVDFPLFVQWKRCLWVSLLFVNSWLCIWLHWTQWIKTGCQLIKSIDLIRFIKIRLWNCVFLAVFIVGNQR